MRQLNVSVVLSLLIGLSAAAQMPMAPPDGMPKAYAKVYSVEVDNALETDTQTLVNEAIARGTIEYIEFGRSLGPAWQSNREVIRDGDPDVARSGYTPTLNFGRDMARQQCHAKETGQPDTTRVEIPDTGYRIDYTLPESDAEPGGARVYSGDTEVVRIAVERSQDQGVGRHWPKIVRMDSLLSKTSLVQFYEYEGVAGDSFTRPSVNKLNKNRELLEPPGSKTEIVQPESGKIKLVESEVAPEPTLDTAPSSSAPRAASVSWSSYGNKGPNYGWNTSSLSPSTNGYLPRYKSGIYFGFELGANFNASASARFNLTDADATQGDVSFNDGSGQFGFNFGVEETSMLRLKSDLIPEDYNPIEEEINFFLPIRDLRAAATVNWTGGLLLGQAYASAFDRTDYISLGTVSLPLPYKLDNIVTVGVEFLAAVNLTGRITGQGVRTDTIY